MFFPSDTPSTNEPMAHLCTLADLAMIFPKGRADAILQTIGSRLTTASATGVGGYGRHPTSSRGNFLSCEFKPLGHRMSKFWTICELAKTLLLMTSMRRSPNRLLFRSLGFRGLWLQGLGF